MTSLFGVFSESFDFSGKRERDRAFRVCSAFVLLLDSGFVTVSFRFRSGSVSTVYHRDRDRPSLFIGRLFHDTGVCNSGALRMRYYSVLL